MDISERELRILGAMLSDASWELIKMRAPQLAKQEGVTRERIVQQASRLLHNIGAAEQDVRPGSEVAQRRSGGLDLPDQSQSNSPSGV